MKKTILLVEDEAIIAMLQKKYLENAGFNVVHVFTGENAVELASNKKRQINLVLMDINLGSGIDGVEATKTNL